MRMRGRRFEVDKAEGRFLGVCAGIARQTGIDATFVRVAVVLLAIFASFFWTAVAYLAAAAVGQASRAARRVPSRIAGRDEARGRMRDLDLRMQAIETYVTSSNSRLAREIEDLR